MNKPRVFLTGGDEIGWAVDEDLKLTRQAIESIVELVDLPEAEIVHGAWWQGLMLQPKEQIEGKRVVCNVPGEPFRYYTIPEYRNALPLVGHWITRTTQAAAQLRSIQIESDLVPYLVDVDTFKPVTREDPSLTDLKKQWNLPEDVYLIGSFQRDTEGSDLRTPKAVKGPDIFLETLLGLKRRGLKFHVVLAGPRRHWILRSFRDHGIDHTYVGSAVESDDIFLNALPRSTLNLLYNILDLYVVASRSEGGPHALLEAGATRCKVISTRVGMAADVLEPACIYRMPSEAVEIIEKDMAHNALAPSVEALYRRVHAAHRPETATPLFQAIYEKMEHVPVFTSKGKTHGALDRSNARPRPDRDLTVGLWHSFFKPPYGGGNQFMLALRKAFSHRLVNVRENLLQEDIDAYVLNSIHFDVDRFLEFSRTHRLNVIHRIDGPIFLIRGYDRDKDELCYRLNAQFASATVIQSAWTYQRIIDMGYNPVSPAIIHNAVDSDIFHRRGRVQFDPHRKIRLISTSWSNNPRKGGPIYKWIEKHLDWNRFEYTFVGNASETFHRIRHIPPVSSEELADLLRQHDVYITASSNDPCSNALIEALACGLPALYLNDGGHPELVGYGGLPFGTEEEILHQLDTLVDDYDSFQKLITVSNMTDVAEKYLSLIREVVK
ncbi:MAG TPA: glycosyltransferase [Desulfomonilaceae bacterium]|nr:glycosyltransferase [Desulfomonilaceae bacterium]